MRGNQLKYAIGIIKEELINVILEKDEEKRKIKY